MARYFFHTDNGGTRRDVVGSELKDLRAVEQEAVVLLGELLRDGPEAFWLSRHLILSVADHDGAELFQLRVSVN